MTQGPTKIRTTAGKATTERRNKPRRSPNGLKNPAIQKLRNVNKLVKIGKIEKQLVSTATSCHEHLVFVQKQNKPQPTSRQKDNHSCNSDVEENEDCSD